MNTKARKQVGKIFVPTMNIRIEHSCERVYINNRVIWRANMEWFVDAPMLVRDMCRSYLKEPPANLSDYLINQNFPFNKSLQRALTTRYYGNGRTPSERNYAKEFLHVLLACDKRLGRTNLIFWGMFLPLEDSARAVLVERFPNE